MILNSALNTEFTFTVGWQHYLMIGIYFLVLIGIGLYAYKHSTSSMDEYTLGGRNIGPWVTALSLVQQICQVGCSWVYQVVCTALGCRAYGLLSV